MDPWSWSCCCGCWVEFPIFSLFFSSFPPLLFHFVFKDFDRSDGDFDSSHLKIDFLQLRFSRVATSWLLRFQFCYFDQKNDNPLSLSGVAEFKLFESVLPARCHRFESSLQLAKNLFLYFAPPKVAGSSLGPNKVFFQLAKSPIEFSTISKLFPSTLYIFNCERCKNVF